MLLSHAAAAAALQPRVEGPLPPLRATADDPYLGHDPGDCVGIDEVGRGALYGPVFAAAVQLPSAAHPVLQAAGLTDSKALSARRRQSLVPLIHHWASCVSLGQSSASEVDRVGIRRATELAMLRALQRRALQPRLLIVDGNLPLRLWSGRQCTLVAGDRHCLAIAAASVLAKQARDALVVRLAQRHVGYGLERHVGYGTARHRAALLDLGPTPLHRRSFLGNLFTHPLDGGGSRGTTAQNRPRAVDPPGP
jgi:ribonuclease HII